MTDYDAFGVTLPIMGTKQGILGFAGKHGYQSDNDSGLQLLGHRYYAPMLGRFLTQDPIGYEGGLNLYAYCNNNPLTHTDDSGTQDEQVDSMRSGHPGMFNGTPRSDMAKQMTHDLIQTLIWSAIDGLTEGVGRVFHLGAVARFERAAQTAEAGTVAASNIRRYAVSAAKMAPHVSGSLKSKSQFLYRVHADELVIKAAEYADANGLWVGNKAKVRINQNIGVLHSTGELTNYVNVYRTETGWIHGSPGTPP